MTGRVDPSRTHALVVAIERYEDHDWDIAGPYADACAFIAWLVETCGVPEKNVTLFSSALPESEHRVDGTPLLRPGIEPRGADSANVPRHLQEGLMTLDADLLWVFWSGHGLIDGSGSHVLLLSDSSTSTKRVVAVDALQLALQSTRVGRNEGRGVPKTAVAVNACQNQPRDETISRIEVSLPTSHVTERGLFVMHACSTGQRARVAPKGMPGEDEAAGLFPRALLRALQDNSGARNVLPDLHEVSDRVDEEFTRLREDGLTAQKPSLLRRNWDGRTVVTGEFDLALTDRERRLAELLGVLLPHCAARGACARLLAARVPVVVPVSVRAETPTVEQLVTAASRVPHGVATLLDVLATLPEACAHDAHSETMQAVHEAGQHLRPDEFLTGDEYADLTRLLDTCGVPDPYGAAMYDRRLRPHLGAPADASALLRSMEAAGHRTDAYAVPVLFRFVSVLAAQTDASSGHDQALREWSTRVAKRLDIPVEAVAAQMRTAARDAERRRREKAWLLVRLEADDPDAETALAAYRCTAWLVDPVTGTQSLRCASNFSPWRHTQLLLADLIEPYVAQEHVDLGVEFFLSVGQLELQVERIPLRHRGVENVPLGSIVTVTVRCDHRRSGWKTRWEACGAVTAPGNHHWLRHDAGDLARLQTALDESPHTGCVELEGSWDEFAPALAYCAEAGVPVMTWHRRLDGQRPAGDLSHLRAAVHPYELPEEVRQMRADADMPSWPGKSHLVLLWDDPQRLPPRIRPRIPGRIPLT
ncbi:VMAP-C domain-containing protein [Streptomyces mirabilis]